LQTDNAAALPSAIAVQLVWDGISQGPPITRSSRIIAALNIQAPVYPTPVKTPEFKTPGRLHLAVGALIFERKAFSQIDLWHGDFARDMHNHLTVEPWSLEIIVV
jgi:hypothetical protein